MNVHTVKEGETLASIAKNQGIRFWANIYLAGENDDLRGRRPNPNHIRPGDQIVIPSKASISELELRAEVEHRLPKLFTQPTLDLCWQACAQMLFCWKHRESNAEAAFKSRLGSDYHKPGGLSMADSAKVLGKLGIISTRIKCINELHENLLARGPLWVAEVAEYDGTAHAQVLTGYNLISCQWYLLDPLGKGMTITFDEIGGATGGAIGSATPANMSRKRGITSMEIHELVFGYGTG